MKNIVLTFAFLLLVHSINFSLIAQGSNEKYQEVDIKTLRATPEEFKNKKISVKTIFRRYQTTFLPYMDKSGFKAGKYYLLQIRPMNLPVMMEKKHKSADLIPDLKPGTPIKVSGRIKKFSTSPQVTTNPHFYLDLDSIEVLEEKEVEQIMDDFQEEVDPFEEPEKPRPKKPIM